MEGARAEAPRDKKMKKFFKIIATVIIAIVALSATTLAAEHEHDWEMFGQNSNSFQVICDDCGTFVSVPTNELACQHEFVTENTATNLCMTRCTKCDYNVQGNHTLEMYVSSKSHGLACITCGYLVSSEEHEWADHDFANNAHIIECTVCGYEETHTATQKVDENGHHYHCTVCPGRATHISHKFTRMPWDENFHAQTCECGYLVLESHNNCGCVGGNEDVESYTTIYGLVTNAFYDVVELNNNISYNSIVEIECEIYDYVEITLNEYHEVVDLRVLVEREVIAANTVADIISDDEPLILIMEDGRALHFSDYEVYSYDDLKLQDGSFICIGENLVIFENEEKSIIIDIWGYDFDMDNDDEIENEVIGYGIITDSFINYDEYGNRYVIAEILVDGEYIEYELDDSLDRWDYNEGSFIEFIVEDNSIIDIEVLIDADILDDVVNFVDYASDRVLDSYSMIEDLDFGDLIIEEFEIDGDETILYFERICLTVDCDYVIYDMIDSAMGEFAEAFAYLQFTGNDGVLYFIMFW